MRGEKKRGLLLPPTVRKLVSLCEVFKRHLRFGVNAINWLTYANEEAKTAKAKSQQTHESIGQFVVVIERFSGVTHLN